ncbi:hypothetical protein KOE73_15640, partial [Acidomonas methanolica]|nr:hypothetical protein [Acidomonas methanolica]
RCGSTSGSGGTACPPGLPGRPSDTDSAVRNLFAPSRSVDTALSRHLHRVRAFAQWNVATTLAA